MRLDNSIEGPKTIFRDFKVKKLFPKKMNFNLKTLTRISISMLKLKLRELHNSHLILNKQPFDE
ncbi:MAG: hypothetical protein ACP5LF_02025 [Nitrososphaeria archaeon]|nr:hypothetical protein [Conexivisphaerales archaeon]